MLEFGLLLILIAALLSIYYTIRIKDIFNPILLFVLPLSLQYIIYYFVYRNIYFVSDGTIIIYFVGMISFVVGYTGFYILPKKKFELQGKENIETKYRVKTNRVFVTMSLLLGIISIFLTKNYLNTINNSVSIYSKNSLNLREAFIDNAQDAPFYVIYGKYFLLFSVLVYWYDFVNKKSKINKWLMFAMLGLLFYNSFNVFSRTDLLVTIVPVVVIYFQSIKLPKFSAKTKKNFIKFTALFVVLVGMFSFMTKQRNVVENVGIFDHRNVTMQYLGRPLPAFEQWAYDKPGLDNSFYAIEPVGKILTVLGGEKFAQTRLAPRGQFNVYTYLRVPYMERGVLGVIVIMLILGLLCHYLFYKYKIGGKYWVIFYAVYAYAIIMSFFAWQFGAMTYFYLALFLLVTSSIDTVFLTKNKNYFKTNVSKNL